MPRITFVSADSLRSMVDVAEGASLMQASKALPFALEGACGGRMGCATCHVVVPEPWFSRLPLWSEREERVLDAAFDITPHSRLGCQVVVDASMDGMVVHLPPAADFDTAVLGAASQSAPGPARDSRRETASSAPAVDVAGRSAAPARREPATPYRRRDGSMPIEARGPVAYMHPADVGRWHVPGSVRVPATLVPDYADGREGVDTVKVLFASDTVIVFESFRRKGTRDTAHVHPDHDAIVYQKRGRVLMRIGPDVFVVEEGDTYFHPRGALHQHEALEDSVRIETKLYPGGGAIAAWNTLVAGSGGAIPVLRDDD
jgi:ferredoxin/mannose-6-phosphate isomerase-like protein (cupin superfamily)